MSFLENIQKAMQPELSEEEKRELETEEALLRQIREGKIDLNKCFKNHIHSYLPTLRVNLKTGRGLEEQDQARIINELTSSINLLQTQLDAMMKGTPKEQAAAKEIAAQHVTMFFRLGEQHKRIQAKKSPPTSTIAPMQFFFIPKGNQKSFRQDTRFNALGIVDKQKACFQALENAYGTKINKPQFLFTLCRVILTIGLICASLVTMPGIGAGIVAIPYAGPAFLAASHFFSNAFGFMGASAMISKGLCTLIAQLGINTIAPRLFTNGMKDLIGSSPETTFLQKGFYEIDNKNGEKLMKNINRIIELADDMVDKGEQNLTQKWQQKEEGEREMGDLGEEDRFSNEMG